MARELRLTTNFGLAAALVVTAASTFACRPSLDNRGFDGDIVGEEENDDSSQPGTIPAPVLSEEVPLLTPYPIIPLRGTVPINELGKQNASHVFVEGINPPLVGYAIGGSFCVEALVEPGAHTITVRAQDRFDQISEPTEITVTYDPNAPALPGLRDCSGTDQLYPCEPALGGETCSNGIDDDCDDLTDEQDPDCGAVCGYDALEPASGGVAHIETGAYRELALCEGANEEDSFVFQLRHNEKVSIDYAATTPQRQLVLRVLFDGEELLATEPRSWGAFEFSTVQALGGGLSSFQSYPFTLEVTEAAGLATSFEFNLLIEIDDDPVTESTGGDESVGETADGDESAGGSGGTGG